jgi:hypothetical protein
MSTVHHDEIAAHLDEAIDSLQRARRHHDSDLPSIGKHMNDAAEMLNSAVAWWAASANESGVTWAQIGEVLGITRQAAHLRYGTVLKDRPLPGI